MGRVRCETAAVTAAALDTATPVRISPRVLLGIYGVALAAAALVAVDLALTGGRLRETAPTDPQAALWLTVLFTVPHIVASYFGFLERDYIVAYGPRLLRGAQVIALATIVLPVISLELMFGVFALFTMSHVFLQQSGISRTLMRGANPDTRHWQWAGIALSTVLYVAIYSERRLPGSVVLLLMVPLVVGYAWLAARAAVASRTTIGTWYFWATASTPVFSWVFFLLGYAVLAIAVPRVIHDLTAFAFYTTHDHNRFIDARSNVLYDWASRLRVPVMVASPVLAVALAVTLRWLPERIMLFPLMFISLLHYYVESFIWKRDSLHRRYISYAPS